MDRGDWQRIPSWCDLRRLFEGIQHSQSLGTAPKASCLRYQRFPAHPVGSLIARHNNQGKNRRCPFGKPVCFQWCAAKFRSGPAALFSPYQWPTGTYSIPDANIRRRCQDLLSYSFNIRQCLFPERFGPDLRKGRNEPALSEPCKMPLAGVAQQPQKHIFWGSKFYSAWLLNRA